MSALELAVSTPPLTCATCGERATCVGRYEDMTEAEPACDACCGHGCEDGRCHRIEFEEHGQSPRDWYRWRCTCGKVGKTWTSRGESEKRGRQHLCTHLGAGLVP